MKLFNTVLAIGLAIFLTACPGMPGGPGGAEAGGGALTFLPFILIFVLFYFLILRPQQKQTKKRNEMLAALKRGDEIITSGGIYGKILNIAEDGAVTLEISKGVNIKISRSAIAGLQPSEKAVQEK